MDFVSVPFFCVCVCWGGGEKRSWKWHLCIVHALAVPDFFFVTLSLSYHLFIHYYNDDPKTRFVQTYDNDSLLYS
jgi:hypothetical protein